MVAAAKHAGDVAAEENNEPVGYAHAARRGRHWTSTAQSAKTAGTGVPPPSKRTRLGLQSRGRGGQSGRGVTAKTNTGRAEKNNEEVLTPSQNSDINQKYF